MRTAFRLLLGSLAAALIAVSPAEAAAASPPNYQGLWWNSPADSESGWGINLAHQGDAIFTTWFTFDTAGDGWWLSMTATRTAEGTYAGTLYETAGPAFNAMPFDPAKVTRTVVGNGTLVFRDADNGTFSYTVNGVQQSKPITRFVFGTVPACTYAARPDLAAATNYQDLWWAAGGTESGWGINLAHQGDSIALTWFTYDRDGTPLWLSAAATRIAPRLYGGSLIRTTGPAFSAVPFDPARVTRTVAGTVTLSFGSGKAATVAYTLDGVTQVKAIARLQFVPPAGTVCAAPAGAVLKGKVHDGRLERALVCADANGNGRCEAGEVQALSDASGAYELALPDGYDGALAAQAVPGTTRDTDPPGAAVDQYFRLASPGRAYSTNLTPYTTLVRLTGESDTRLAEELVRNELGLPPGFNINPTAAPAEGSLAKSVAKAVVSALKSLPSLLDYSAPDALAKAVAAFPAALTELPRLKIDTSGIPIDSREVYVDATFVLANPAAATPEYRLNGKIRGRGNSTWWEAKKPYKVQFTNDASYAKVPDFLGMKRNRNWALLADHLDHSLIRNKLALTVGNSSAFAEGLKWTPSGQHVEVTLNGSYAGVYLLTEDIRIASSRLAIREMSTSAAAGQVDGGFIVEVDYPQDCYWSPTLNMQHQTPQGVRMCVDTPDEEDITPAQLAYAKGYVNAVEADLYGSGDLSKINPLSFADWYLLQELFRNEDAIFYSSDFMWKDTAGAAIPSDRLLNMGPIWDFDIAAGNSDQYQPDGCWVNKTLDWLPNWPNWFAKVFDHREFLNLTLARWQEKRPVLEKLIPASIAAFERRLKEAQARNFDRWEVLGTDTWTNHYVFGTYEEEVAWVKRFLRQRMDWMDQAFASPEAFVKYCK